MRLSLSLARTFRTHYPVKMPGTPSGKRRPCRPLLQLVVVAFCEMHRISRSVDVNFLELTEQKCNTTYFAGSCLLEKGQQQAGSLAGVAPCRKDICRAQRQAHPVWKSGVECEGKSLSDCVSKSTKRRVERRT